MLASRMPLMTTPHLLYWSFSGYLVVLSTLLPHHVKSQIQQPACLPGFEWLYNNRSQSPCLVNTYLCRACRPPDQYDNCIIGTIASGYVYENYEAPLYCDCSTIEWMLLGACGACQGGGVDSWSTYQRNCTELYLSRIPTDIPVNTTVPAWAYLALGENDDDFNLTRIQEFVKEGGHPDSSAIIPTPTVSSTSSILSASQQSTLSSSAASTSTSGRSSLPSVSSMTSSNAFSWSSASSTVASATATTNSDTSVIVPPIVGGIVGGTVGIAAVVGVFLYWFVRRNGAARRQIEAEQATLVPPQSDWKSGSRIYNPNDPTTYPLVVSETGAESTRHHTDLSYARPSSSVSPSSSSKIRDGYKGFAEVS